VFTCVYDKGVARTSEWFWGNICKL